MVQDTCLWGTIIDNNYQNTELRYIVDCLSCNDCVITSMLAVGWVHCAVLYVTIYVIAVKLICVGHNILIR